MRFFASQKTNRQKKEVSQGESEKGLKSIGMGA